jgi:pyruvate kinase
VRRTKIVCTIGPASADEDTLRRLAEAGMDVARLNFSHGSHDEHARVIERLRRIGGVAVLQDLSGPRVRIGELRGGRVTLEAGAWVTLVPRAVAGDARTIGVNTPRLIRALRRGDVVLLADGTLQLEVARANAEGARCRVVVGGALTARKGINVPTRSLELPAMTAKDRRDLRFGIAHAVDLVALSFVQNGQDVRRCRRLAGRPVVAKIEKHEALARLDEILAAADGVMVARGDLGVEIPLERVPIEQKRVLRAANAAGRPAVTATQMLRSMVESPRPTRAEVADVANAVLDGTDAVMLSEETAVGRHPVEAVRTMARVVEQADPHVAPRFGRERKDDSAAIAEAACELAVEVGAVAIVVPTEGGSSVRRVAACRPPCRILALSANARALRPLRMVWGVEGHPAPALARDRLEAIRREAGRHVRGKVVITAGWPFRERGHTNLALVTTV